MDNLLAQRYEKIKGLVTQRREEFDRLMHFLENETAWLSAPASSKFHLCREHGLIEHACNVAENLLRIKGALAPGISDESCAIVALLHDAGKAGMPGNPQYLPNDPTEKQKKYGYPASVPYRFNNALTYLSVPVRSLYLCLPYLALTAEEAQAIMYHDGQYVADNSSVATREAPLTLLLQYADSWSSFVTEKE